MSELTFSASLEYLCYGCTAINMPNPLTLPLPRIFTNASTHLKINENEAKVQKINSSNDKHWNFHPLEVVSR